MMAAVSNNDASRSTTTPMAASIPASMPASVSMESFPQHDHHHQQQQQQQPLHFDADAVSSHNKAHGFSHEHSSQPASHTSQVICRLLDLGIQFYEKGRQDDAMEFLNAAHQLLSDPSIAHPQSQSLQQQQQPQAQTPANVLSSLASSLASQAAPTQAADVAKCEHCAATSSTESFLPSPPPVDTYHEDECDVGPRAFSSALAPTCAASLLDPNLLGMYVGFNRALIHHSRNQVAQALSQYQQVLACVNDTLSKAILTVSAIARTWPFQDLYLLGMQTLNNIGQIQYSEHSEAIALTHFESALAFTELLVALPQPSPHNLHNQHIHSQQHNQQPQQARVQLDCATILSNWCRARWMMGDVSDKVRQSLNEVLRIRSTHLGWDHVDVAAAHYNLGVTDYARNAAESAMAHLSHYLRLSSHRVQTYHQADLDPIPALIHILLLHNEGKTDKVATDIVQGLRALNDKRQDLGPTHAEVASLLNYVGTLLFHQRDLNHALLFFQEELQLEEEIVDLPDDKISVSVTCNNIGRILQDLGRFPEAIYYYQRSLRPEFGEIITKTDDCNFRNKMLVASNPSSSPTPVSTASAAASTASNTAATATSNVTTGTTTGASSYYKPVPSIAAMTQVSDLSPATMNLYSTVWYNLGLIHDKMSAYPDAIMAFQMSLMLRRTMLGRDHADVACLLYNIGVLQMEQHMLEEATESFREALRIRRVVSTGQLNDQHVIKTLQKLATLHQAKGNIAGALEACREVLSLVTASDEVDAKHRSKEMAVAMLHIAELHHARGDLSQALSMTSNTVQLLQQARRKLHDDHHAFDAHYSTLLEQETKGLLLMGSLRHELCEPSLAQAAFTQAASVIQYHLSVSQHMASADASARALTSSGCSNGMQASASTLCPMLEVSKLLSQLHCAPEA